MADTGMRRRTILALATGLCAASLLPAWAATPAEAFIADNIQKGLSILKDPQLSEAARADQFQQLLLSLVNTKRIASFTLGQYVRTASQSDLDEFAAAFQDYSIAVYRSYLARYAGQSLKVTGSSQRAPDDFIVTTVMVDPNDRSGQRPLEVDFRVRTDSGRPELVDISVLGIWLALSQRDQFVAFLAQNKGDVKALTTHMRQTVSQYR
jgi:phospholipid transport system substrate-binding protein